VVVSLVGDDAPPGRLDVEVPGGLLTERPRHHEAVAERAHAERRGVNPAGLSTAVAKHADDRHPAPPSDQQRQRIDQTGGEADELASARTKRDTPRADVHRATS